MVFYTIYICCLHVIEPCQFFFFSYTAVIVVLIAKNARRHCWCSINIVKAFTTIPILLHCNAGCSPIFKGIIFVFVVITLTQVTYGKNVSSLRLNLFKIIFSIDVSAHVLAFSKYVDQIDHKNECYFEHTTHTTLQTTFRKNDETTNFKF